MTRWINTKEEHASKIITLVASTLPAREARQRPKTPFKSEEDFVAALQSHHSVMLKAVKCKQTVDPANADALESAVKEMGKMYLPA
eukprot:CAMPEP_0206461754 /NCGR_PEP_ID=MMETSP0324_2-20121206/25558_1 /ASSEMBLY_ACC=CAM_ASM_000836 /TAXON_ID=2866 /ORGANISM="Crypthecodinium cohnii, Strain Seligo" /LENGTH=85 /DNA_ID=CAMNT_0053933753 /DNA_START=382 /DNA_END=640 /DNA_ORIENTATION=+